MSEYMDGYIEGQNRKNLQPASLNISKEELNAMMDILYEEEN